MSRIPGGSPAAQHVTQYAAEQGVTISARKIERWSQQGLAPRVAGKDRPPIEILRHYVALAETMPASGVDKSPAIISMAVQGYHLSDDAVRTAALALIESKNIVRYSSATGTAGEFDETVRMARQLVVSDEPVVRLLREGLTQDSARGDYVTADLTSSGTEIVEERLSTAITSVLAAMRGDRLYAVDPIVNALNGWHRSEMPTDTKIALCRFLESLNLDHSELVNLVSTAPVQEILSVARRGVLPYLYPVTIVTAIPATTLVEVHCLSFDLACYLALWGFDSLTAVMTSYAGYTKASDRRQT